jgi:nitroreductase
MIKYDFIVNPWQIIEQNFPRNRDEAHRLAFLLRYAILAPSSHNTQPWKFAVSRDEIAIFVNKDRWLRVADADQRELYTSVGCALENLLVAAEHFGYGYQLAYFPEVLNQGLVASVEFLPGRMTSSFRGPELFDAIDARHTNHLPYDPRPIPEDALERIKACVIEEGIALHLTGDLEPRRKADELAGRADAIQFADPDFCEELGYWIGEGAFGTPWLLTKLAQLASAYLDLGKYVAKPNSERLLNAPVFGIICAKENDRLSQVKVGQVFERIYLTATALGIRLQPMSQLTAVPEIRAELADLIPKKDTFPQQPFRLGYAEAEGSHTPRRPIAEIMV